MESRTANKLWIAAALFVVSGNIYCNEARAAAADDPLLVMGLLDQLEIRDIGGDRDVTWDAQGWVGKDLHKLWLKTEGERADRKTEEFELQLLYSKAIARYWDIQVGVRHDFEPSPSRSWAVIGVQGLAPYFFETDVAIFVGDNGRTALRLDFEYESLLTQRLILTPELEANFYGKNDPEIGVGSGLSTVQAGLRLRYEIRREIAPYIGINWSKSFGNTAEFAAAAGQERSETQMVVGIRAWF